MAAITLGQTIVWGLTVTDDHGAFADLGGGLPTGTVTLPDGTTVIASVSRESLGHYVALLTSTQVGLHPIVWTGSGANSGGLPFHDSAWVEAFIPRLTSPEDLAEELQRDIPDDLLASAGNACSFADAVVAAYIRRDVATLTGAARAVARGVAMRVAARRFDNPRDLGAYSMPEAASYTPSPNVSARILTGDERAALDWQFGARDAHVGSIRTAVAPWMTPATSS